MFLTLLCPRDRRTTKPVARRPLRPTGVDDMEPAAARRPMKSRDASMRRCFDVSMCRRGALHLVPWRS